MLKKGDCALPRLAHYSDNIFCGGAVLNAEKPPVGTPALQPRLSL